MYYVSSAHIIEKAEQYKISHWDDDIKANDVLSHLGFFEVHLIGNYALLTLDETTISEKWAPLSVAGEGAESKILTRLGYKELADQSYSAAANVSNLAVSKDPTSGRNM